jgi:23S rRNA (cytidine1920-2'-O)/16S rRNA (cytidine1409-2'-O)-methyltransferase
MKLRLDELLVQKKLAATRSQAKLLIKEGKVLVNKQLATKPSQSCAPDTDIQLTTYEQYVSRGAFKLKGALEKFQIDPKGLTVADVGASTGGFSDYLLQNGVEKIYCIDVGHSQLAPKIAANPKVENLENTDIRKLESLPTKPDLAVVDLSFISLRLTLPHIKNLLQPNSPIIALFKPQFEAGPKLTPRDGVIKDPETLKLVRAHFKTWCEENNFKVEKIIPSPIKGKGGNTEYLALIY